MTVKESLIPSPRTPFEGEVRERAALDQAAHALVAGEAVVFDNGPVFAVLLNGANKNTVNHVLDAKKRPKDKPFAFAETSKWFADMVEAERVAAHIQPLFEHPEELAKRTSGLLFVRAPITEAAVTSGRLPEQFLSRDKQTGKPVAQNYDPAGKPALAYLLGRARELAERTGIAFLPGITSHNHSGDGEIVDLDEAKKLAQANRMIFLGDELARRDFSGSFGIIEANQNGLWLRRQPNFAPYIVKQMFGSEYPVKVDPINYQLATNPSLPAEVIQATPGYAPDLPADDMHQLVLQHYQG
jgi:hypothetical protein